MANHGSSANNKDIRDEGIPTASYDGATMVPGARIGQFRIEREIGRGAMGVVYLAHDSKLDRQVAIKSLPAEVMANPKARVRFSREARTLASLNHPNIATIHDELEESEGNVYLVLEYIPGQTLAERIAKGDIKLQESLSISLQVAEAVSTAHDHDVIHRDLKPENIKITAEGKIKVLDFGLAKAVGAEGVGQQSTVTEPGRILGTPAYMSPEQARGQATDKRSDIWAFGCILYEMLTAKIPFRGETVSDTLANILQTEPDWKKLPENTPHSVKVLLRRCMWKDPHKRLRDIGDAALEISETLTEMRDTGTPLASTQSIYNYTSKPRQMVLWTIACMLFSAIVATVITLSLKQPIPVPSRVSRFPINLPYSQMLNDQVLNVAVSPDGKRVVYAGGLGTATRLFLRELDQIEGKELPETEGASLPFFSPDGQSIGFGANGKLKTLFLDGGKPKALCAASNLLGASWGPDDTIYFSPAITEGLWQIPAHGGFSERVTTPDREQGELAHWWPEVLPDGETVLFTIWKTSLDDACIAVYSSKTGKQHTLVTRGACARYVPTGHLVYGQSGTLVAAPFDLTHLKAGEHYPLIEGLKQMPLDGGAPFSFSQNGVLSYVRGGEWLARRRLVWVDRQGKEIKTLPLPPQAYAYPRLSPDGQRIAFTQFHRGTLNIWVCDLPNGRATQVTFEGNNNVPVWMPDNNRLTFASCRAGPFDIYRIPTNGGSSEELLVTGPHDQTATSWSNDEKIMLFTKSSPVTNLDIWFLSSEGDGVPQPLISNPGRDRNAVFSPDGQWIAYESNREGQDEIYVRKYLEPVQKKISSGGGYHPVWSPDGKELFYRNGDKMMAIDIIETEPELEVTDPEVLFEGHYYTGKPRNYDISPDGHKFLMLKEDEEKPSASQLIVVLNWFEELERLVPTEGE